MTVRPAHKRDSPAIARLSAQLGYEVAAEEVEERLQCRGDLKEIFVAVDGRELVGWIALGIEESFVTGRGCHIEGLVVDAMRRSEGIGARLLAQAESWCREKAVREMRVHSNVIRDRAHPFYERNGYARIKSQHYFTKTLRP